jgi:UDPglucose 6-dehydrogenase
VSQATLDLTATTDLRQAVSGTSYVIVSTPTTYNESTNTFDTSSVENIIRRVLQYEPRACIVIKSNVPVGFIEMIREQLQTNSVMFSPEFLREGKALYDNLYPSRVIVGEKSKRAEQFANLLVQGAKKKNISILFTGAREAESIKLFSNTYLAMRIAFFNELDSYALNHDVNSLEIVKGVSLDDRIGGHYNNPSFGYGGYCLPKDTKQLLASFKTVPQSLMQAIVDPNFKRRSFLADVITKTNPQTLGIYRLIMKQGSNNFRQSSIQELIKQIAKNGTKVLIYEPMLTAVSYLGVPCRAEPGQIQNSN